MVVDLVKRLVSGLSVCDSRRQSLTMVWIALVSTTVVSLIISLHYLPTVVDDALISYRYSDRLLHGKGLTWNDGEFVEGYSNLLWVLLIAAGGLIEPNLVLVGWALGTVLNCATLGAIAWVFGRSPGSSSAALWMAALLLACTESFAFSAVGGMETSLFVALLSWALALAYRPQLDRVTSADWFASLLFGLLALTRPDGGLLGVSAGVAELLRCGTSRTTLKRIALFAGAPVVFAGFQTLFRMAYYGSPVPNTSFAKLTLNFDRMLDGCWYIAKGTMNYGALFIVVLLSNLMLNKEVRRLTWRRNLIFIVPGAIWLTYILVIGGDWFPFERQWQPALLCLVLMVGGFLSALPPTELSRWVPIIVAASVVHLSVQGGFNPYNLDDRTIRPYIDEFNKELIKADPTGRAERKFLSVFFPNRADALRGYHRDYMQCIELGGLLKTAFAREQPLIAVNPAGCLPYYSSLPAIDMLGLNDSYIAHHLPSDMGHGFIGHELGDGDYVLSRNPDIIVFCELGNVIGFVVPCFRGERKIVVSDEFRKLYRLVRYFADGFEMQGWTRIEGGRIGVRRSADKVYIPGYLLATTRDARAMLDTYGRLATSVQNGEGSIDDVELPPGTWEITLDTDGRSPLLLRCLPTSGVTQVSGNGLRVTSDGEHRTFKVVGTTGLIYGITAQRVRPVLANSP